MLVARRVLIFAALWLAFECMISWLATCLPEHHRTTNYVGEKDHCTLFGGPVIGISRSAIVQVARFLHTYEHELVAGFTIVLAFSTIGLWLATKHLWEITDETLNHAEQTAER